MDYLALKSEINTDPLTLGYAAKTDQQIADILNTVPASASAGRQLARDVIETWEILEATDTTEWAALSASEKQRYQTIVSAGTVSVKGSNVRAAFAAMFSAGPTRTALLALQNKAASRAMTLFGEFVNYFDVARAKAS